MCIYTLWLLVVDLVKAKGDRKRGVHVRVVCIVPIHCACVYTYFVLFFNCHTTHTNLYRLAASMHCVFMLYCMDDVCHTTHVCHHTEWRLCTDGSSLLG